MLWANRVLSASGENEACGAGVAAVGAAVAPATDAADAVEEEAEGAAAEAVASDAEGELEAADAGCESFCFSVAASNDCLMCSWPMP